MIYKHDCWKKQHPNNYKNYSCIALAAVNETCIEKVRDIIVNVACWPKGKGYIIEKGEHEGNEIPDDNDSDDYKDKSSSFPDKLFVGILKNMSNI